MATASGAAVLVEKLSLQDGPKPRLKICGGVEEMIGGTPMVEVTSILKADGAVARVVAKIECLQPGGSVKDRIVLPWDFASPQPLLLSSSSILMRFVQLLYRDCSDSLHVSYILYHIKLRKKLTNWCIVVPLASSLSVSQFGQFLDTAIVVIPSVFLTFLRSLDWKFTNCSMLLDVKYHIAIPGDALFKFSCLLRLFWLCADL